MIKNDFYTTQTTEPNTGNQVTNTLNALNISAPSNAYWLGWVRPENTPTAYKFSSYSVSPQQIQFFDVTEENNYDIGYLSGYNTNNYTYSNIVLPNNPINTQYVRYINKLDCMGVGITFSNVALRFRVYVESGLANDEMTGRTVREFGSPSLNAWQYMSMKDFYDFLHGDYTLQLSVQSFYSGFSTVNINLSNADEMGVVYVETTSEYSGTTYYDHIYFTIADYMFTAMRTQTAVFGTIGQSMSIVPAIGIHANDNYFVSCTHSGMKSATVGAMNFDGTWYGTTWNNSSTGFSFGVLSANPIGTIPASLKTQSGFAIFTGNIMVWNRVNTRFEISRVFTANDILKHLSLFPRIVIDGDATAPNPQYGYYANHSYATHVTDENEFKAELITGDLTDDTFKEKLRLWQWDNAEWEENNYTEDDRPPYEPEPESSDDWSGDRILAPVISGIGDLNGFITMYGLTPSQIAALGNYLWAKFTDVSFWESISIVLDNTASIDPSNILNYVVSVRAYPFDLSDVSGTTSDFPLVYFGRGLVGVPVDNVLSGTVKVIHKCVDTFAGGDMDVPANYGDFRDMEPCAKILLHVPFCGSCEINPSQVVGKHLFLRYTIDFATGGMMAICFTSDSNGVMAYPVAELHGHIGASVQLTASNEMDALQSIAGIGTGIMGLMTGNQAGLLSGVMGAASSLSSNRAAPHSTGRASGFSAYFQPRTPYIEIIYDQYYKPSDYAHTHGNACQIVDKIGNLHGYTVCRNVDTTGLTCEMDERLSIKRILESGFFVD